MGEVINKAKGAIKQTVGELTGDPELKEEGKRTSARAGSKERSKTSSTP